MSAEEKPATEIKERDGSSKDREGSVSRVGRDSDQEGGVFEISHETVLASNNSVGGGGGGNGGTENRAKKTHNSRLSAQRISLENGAPSPPVKQVTPLSAQRKLQSSPPSRGTSLTSPLSPEIKQEIVASVSAAQNSSTSSSPTHEGSEHLSLLLPSFLRNLADPSVKSILICGCGGGFDFMHSMTVYPELIRLQKKITIASYSFGNPLGIEGGEVVFKHANAGGGNVIAAKVNAKCKAPKDYGPEVGMCDFLDQEYPLYSPHSVYALYARDFTVPTLREFYQQLCAQHNVDCVVLFDGGSDSLMMGDEEGLGDPIEDAVSVAAVATLTHPLKHRFLVSLGFGCDRYNSVSDAASLRAVAELTQRGGFMGTVALEPSSPGLSCYRRCVEHVYSQYTFRSVLTGSVIAAAQGHFGAGELPANVQMGGRVKVGTTFIWPLMSMLFAFDCVSVYDRSLICKWIKDCSTVPELNYVLHDERTKLKVQRKLRLTEDLPSEDMMRHGGPGHFPVIYPTDGKDETASPKKVSVGAKLSRMLSSKRVHS